jgi:excisionase family DNA binding protein
MVIRDMTEEIKPNIVYTTEETRDFLKVSESTIKRLLKRGAIRAYKVGGQYRILGVEILRLVSPEVESGARRVYRKLKSKAKRTIAKW